MSIYKKLLEAKKEMNAITKDSKNPFFKSKYFDINKLLSEVEPVLQKHGLVLLQPIQDGMVKTEIHNTDEDGFVSSQIQLPNIQDPQKLGGAITYFRRYTLQSLLGLQAEDDDANTASKYVQNPPKKTLTDQQFEASFSGTKVQIKTVLDKYDLTKIQREELTKHYNSL